AASVGAAQRIPRRAKAVMAERIFMSVSFLLFLGCGLLLLLTFLRGAIAGLDGLVLGHVLAFLGVAVPLVAFVVVDLRRGVDPHHALGRGRLTRGRGLRRLRRRRLAGGGLGGPSRRGLLGGRRLARGRGGRAERDLGPDLLDRVLADAGLGEVVHRGI